MVKDSQNNVVSIIEQFTQSKTGDESQNEDALFISDHYIAVIDGATSKTSIRYEKKTSGRIIRDSIMNALSMLEGSETFDKAVRKIHLQIVATAKQFEIDYMCGSTVIYSIKRREIWSVGDCQMMIGTKLFTNKKRVDLLLGELRSMAIRAMIRQGVSKEILMSEDASRNLILPFLKLQKAFENTSGPYGFYVLNSSPLSDETIMHMAEIYPVPQGTQVILASDGYPVLKDSLSESEEQLKRILINDPLCYIENPSTKGLLNGNRSFDDRTYIRFCT